MSLAGKEVLNRVSRSADGGCPPGDGGTVLVVIAGNRRLVLAGACRAGLGAGLGGLAREASRAGSRHGHPLLNMHDNKAEHTGENPCCLPAAGRQY